MQVKYKINIILLFTAIVLGYIVIWFRYYGYLTFIKFVLLTLAVALVLPTLLLLLRNNRFESTYPRVNLKKVEWFLLLFPALSALLEMLLLGITGLFTVVTLACGLMLLAFSRSKTTVPIKASLLLATITYVHYGVYAYIGVNADPWRDAAQALQIVERGGIRDLTITFSPYSLPIVPVLYAMHSIMTGLNTLWSSNIIGIIYLILLSLWIYMAARRFDMYNLHVAVILALSLSLIVIWSAGFIPQTYALLMAIPLLFLDLPSVVIPILAVAMVLGHVGLSLWSLTILVLMVFAKKVLKTKAYSPNHVITRLYVVALAALSYITFTLLPIVLKGTITQVIRVIELLLVNEKISLEVAQLTSIIPLPISSILGVIPIIVIIALSLVVLIEPRDALTRLLALASLVLLGIGLIGNFIFPSIAYALPRYLGLGSLAVLAILSPLGVQALAGRGRPGVLYAILLVFLAITSFAFSGTITPGNPYTASPYSPWSIRGLLTYSETKMLDDVRSLLCCNTYLVDWRIGSYLLYKYLWVRLGWFRESYKFYNPETQGTFIFVVDRELYIAPGFLEKYGEVFILRKATLEIHKVLTSPDLKMFLYDPCEAHILYDSSAIRIYSLASRQLNT